MKTYFKIVKWTMIVVAVILVAALLTAWIFLRSTLPEYEGEVKVSGLSSPVEIVRDNWGMPHIFAKSDADAYFALGYCAAQDRLFQMDLLRRAIRGRLAEILGPKLLKLDLLFRTLTAPRSLEEMAGTFPPEIMQAMDAYSKGVNAFLANPDESLPPEFQLLGYEPEPWQPADGMAGHYFMSYGLNASLGIELTHAAVIEKVGEELASELFAGYPEGYPVIVPKAKTDPVGWKLDLLDTLELAERFAGFPSGGASNSWVIAGEKSTTGKPILANDMHLGHSLPGIWYEAHLVTPDQNVSGVTLAGIPFIIVGANPDVAWGFTNSMVDDTDFYIEKFNPANPEQVEYQGGFENIRFKEEILRVRGQAEQSHRVRSTRHGPILSDLADVEAPEGRAISMRWTATELFRTPLALYRANRARSVAEVEAAASEFKCPGQNWVFADRHGDIGYLAAAGIPVREGFSGDQPLPGWDGEHEWSGFVPTGEQPRLRNPAEGFVATANNRIADDDYPHVIARHYAMPDRITRIRQMIGAKQKLSVKDCESMHADLYVVLAEEWVPMMIRVLKKQEMTGIAAQALKQLEDWDFVAGAEQVAPSIFHATVNFLVQGIFQERLGEDLYQRFIKGMNRYLVFNAMRKLVESPDSEWFDDLQTSDVETRDDRIAESFERALGYLTEKMGDSVTGWVWGNLHTVTFYHPVGRYSELAGWLLNAGPYPMGGSFATVNPAPYPLGDPWEVTAGASQRMIIDFADRKNSLRVLPAGINGNFMSDHYDDQVEMWRQGKYRPFDLTREAAEKDARYRLTLTPE